MVQVAALYIEFLCAVWWGTDFTLENKWSPKLLPPVTGLVNDHSDAVKKENLAERTVFKELREVPCAHMSAVNHLPGWIGTHSASHNISYFFMETGATLRQEVGKDQPQATSTMQKVCRDY